MKLKYLLFLLVAGLGFLSVAVPKLSIFATLLLVISFAALTRFEHSRKRVLSQLLIASSLFTFVGLMRFIWTEALPGIAEARGRASSKKAVSLLREILFAEDALRRYAMIDPDGDGIGSAGRLGELSGQDPARSSPLKIPPLARRFAPRTATQSGPATEQDGYLMIVCLPGTDESWVTHPASPVDEEKSERRWVAYAWPVSEKLEHETAYFIDEHERILESVNRLESRAGDKRRLRLVGAAHSPSCTDALDSATRSLWKPWNGKKARRGLPGDTRPTP